MQNLSKYTFFVLLILFAILGYLSVNSEIIHLDEKECHLPTTDSFYEKDILNAIQDDDYLSASTPLPYILVAGIYKIFAQPPAIYSARLINVFISFVTLLLFWLLIEDKSISVLGSLIILFFYPYYLKPTFAFFMAIYGILFYLSFLYFIGRGEKPKYFLAGLSLTLAILSQQFYLIIIPFAFIFFGYQYYKSQNLKSSTLSPFLPSSPHPLMHSSLHRFIRSSLHLFLFFLPLLLLIPLFLIWGGLTHPAWSSWGVEFRIEYFTAVIVVIGSTLFPFTLFYIKQINWRILGLFFVLSIFLSIFAYPAWVNAPTVGGISGYTFHIIDIIFQYSPFLGFIVKTVLTFFGLSSLIILSKYRKSVSKFLFPLLIILAFGFMINKLPSERHMIPLIVTQYLIVFQIIKKEIIYKTWIPLQIILGSAYFFYIMFLYRSV